MWKELMVTLGFWKAPPPSLIMSAPSQTSTCLPASPIRRTIKQSYAQIRRCYTQVTEYRGGPEGRVVLHLDIAKDGSVRRVTTDGSLSEPRVTECLVRLAKQWQFPSSDTELLVHYPLDFVIGP